MHDKRRITKVTKCFEEVNRYEEALQVEYRKRMQEQMRAYLEGKDRELSEGLKGRRGYVYKGLVKRKIATSVGVIEIRVRRYKMMGGGSCYPLRDVGGIGRATGLARQRCVGFAIERSYEWSKRMLEEVCGMDVSRMEIWKIVQEEGKRLHEELEKKREEVFSEGKASGDSVGRVRPAVVELDGTMIASREAAERDEFGRQRMEVKVGVIFRGIAGTRRKRTCERTVYARVENSESFGEQWYTTCSLHGLGANEPVRVVSDGARWIRNVGNAMFPGHRYTLDLFHLKKKAREVLLTHQYKQFMTLVMTALPHAALQYLKGLRPSDQRHRKQLHEFIQYVEENLDGMQYRRGTIRGSGVVEKLVDVIVKKRMKRQGMRWSTKGANAILALRSQWVNNNSQQSQLMAPSS